MMTDFTKILFIYLASSSLSMVPLPLILIYDIIQNCLIFVKIMIMWQKF